MDSFNIPDGGFPLNLHINQYKLVIISTFVKKLYFVRIRRGRGRAISQCN